MTRGIIYTFYSFKGGVGRSMALANLAQHLHEKGLRVIAIDWDLEAPGLEAYFYPIGSEQIDSARAHSGLIDMLDAYKDWYRKHRNAAACPTPTPEEQAEYARNAAEVSRQTRHLVKQANVPSFLLEPMAPEGPVELGQFLKSLSQQSASESAPVSGKLGSSPLQPFLQRIRKPDSRDNGLFMLSAGSRGEGGFGRYATLVQEFDWSELYARYDARSFFNWFREELLGIADVILIDSRTGVTEMGGVCTRHIPDVVVSFCAPNQQNMDGVVRVVTGVNKSEVKEARDDRHVDVMVIPTRIDNSESERLRDFSERFHALIENDAFVPEAFRGLRDPLWNLQIPYIPRYNYKEELVLGAAAAAPDPATQKLVEAYRRIAVHLAALAEQGQRIRDVFAAEISTTLPGLEKKAPQMTPPVSEQWVERPKLVEELKSVLLVSARTPDRSRVAVWGFAGSGKTAVVARVCRHPDVTAAFPHGILWFPADRRWTPSRVEEWFSASLGASARLTGPALKEQLRDHRFLIVLDGVSNLEDVTEVLEFGGACTQLLITRDQKVASQFSKTRVNVSVLFEEESRSIVNAGPDVLAESNGETYELAKQVWSWPLGASLVRASYQRLVDDGAETSAAWAQLRNAFERHGVLAFDQLGATDPTNSIARILSVSLSSLSATERALLVSIAKAKDGMKRSEAISAPSASDTFAKLTNMGLVQSTSQSDVLRVHPLIQAYLQAAGELEQQPGAKQKARRASSSEDKLKARDVEQANRLLGGEAATLDEIEQLAERLKDARYFSYARRLFARARKHPTIGRQPEMRILKFAQREAHCTYRDLDLSAEQRFAGALAILNEADLRRPEPSAETLGLAGAVYKYQWKQTGYRRDLEASLANYGRGAARGVAHDFGYTAINAAYVLDVLAQLERQESALPPSPRTAEALALREQICRELPQLGAQPSNAWLKSQWWFFATLAEASFGLKNHDDARYWLREGLAAQPPDWQLDTTTRQLTALAVAQGQDLVGNADAARTLRVLVGDAADAVTAMAMGKVGVALSGGGFRASLFHIGVLARLAELDLLRHVEVLSCVSGGSIVGAHYYLEVRRLLKEKYERDIKRVDYLEIVERLIREFTAATQKNLRTRLFAAWIANLKSIFVPSYTRTTRLGRLFERHIYSRVPDGHKGPRWLNDLAIQPRDFESTDFNPKLDNWRRAAKAPILLLNATSLNTGHNWQFAVKWMGEPPLGASSAVDRNEIYRRLYYWEAPLRHRKVRLGEAVVASACVPALFDPVELHGLFPDRSIRLVDGGVHDNQGTMGLLEQECSVVIVSDASGQTNSDDDPSGELPAVAGRSNNVLMARVREAEFRELELLRRSAALNGFAFLHLKKELEVRQLDWVDCQDPYEPHDETAAVEGKKPLTSYGIPRTIQTRLAGMRTDLDSFSDAEAYALMLSGYRMAVAEFKSALGHLPLPPTEEVKQWAFLQVNDAVMRSPGYELEHAKLVRLLSISKSRALKVWRLAPLPALGIVAGTVAALAGSWLLVRILLPLHIPGIGQLYVGEVPPFLAVIAKVPWQSVLHYAELGLGAFAGAGLLSWLAFRIMGPRKSLTVVLSGLMTVTVGWIFAGAHLLLFDRLYRWTGKVRKQRVVA